jgi:molecular chaperone DnaK
MADGMIHATRKTLEEAGDKVEAEEKASIEGAISDLEAAIKTDDKDAIEAKTQALTEVSSNLAQRMYAETQQADAQPEAAAAETGGDPDAVDAEFEEVKEDK